MANTKKIDLNRVLLVNSKGGMRVVIDRVVYEGCVDSTQIATIMRGKGIAVTGLNCQWLEGDTCTLAWKDADGAEQTAQIVPVSSTVTEMHFAWPEALNDAPLGDVKMHFLTRGGNPDGQPQPNDKTVTLIEAERIPTVTKVATTEKDGIVKGQAFDALGANLGFNFATDHVSVKWTEGGTPRQAAIVPESATADKIAFSACERLFNSDDATNFFKGVTRVTDDLRKVQILAAMRQDGAIALPEVTEVEGCIVLAPNEQGEPTVPINMTLPLMESTWPHMAAIRAPGSDMYTDATMALPLYDLPNVKKLATGTFENCEWSSLAQGTDGISASAFAGCGFNMDVQAYEHTREEVERLANFPWGIADKSAQYPAKVFTADPPEGGDHWVVERDPATGKCRLVAP